MKLGGFAGRVALVLGLAAATPAAAQTLVTDAAGLRELAALSLAEENWAQARTLAEALLERDPNDLAALAMLATATFNLRDFPAARQASAQIYRSDAPERQRYDAARLAALAAANEDRFTLSELWLRRALIVAPTPEDVAQTTEDAGRVRRANPWSTQVHLSFSPSTNINGGATSELNIIDGVPVVGILTPSAQALTGFVALANLATSYRLNETREQRQMLTGRIYARAPIPIGDDLQAIWDEGVEIEEFSNALIELTFSHDQVLSDGLYGIDASIGAVWSGAEHDYNYARLGGDRTFRISPELSFRASGFFEQRFAPETFEREDHVINVAGAFSGRLPNGDSATASLAWTGRESDSINYTYDSYTAQLTYVPAERLGPAEVSGTLGITHTDYPDYLVGFIIVPDGRQDTRLFGSLSATFPEYSFAGFAPLVKVTAGTTDSNVSRFELNDFGVEFGLRSTF